MSDPLAFIPSLIPTPVPLSSSVTTPRPPKEDESKDDKFSSLFSPPTPPASRNSTPNSSTPPIFPESSSSTEPTKSRPKGHGRTQSEADWGTFVSVPTTQDPLGDFGEDFASPVGAREGAAQADPSFEFFESFGESARQASDAKRHSVLDELFNHEDDPLYFLAGPSKAAAQSLSGHSPAFSSPEIETGSDPRPIASSSNTAQPSLLDRSIDVLFGEPSSPTLGRSTAPPSGAPPLLDRRSTTDVLGSPSFTPSESHASGLLEALSSTHDAPSGVAPKEILPHEPTRSSSFASRWIPTMRAERRGSLSPSVSTSGTPSISASSTLTATLSRTVAAALAGGPPPSASYRENPFSVHTFVPASGAPGYIGERPRGAASISGGTFEFKAEDAEEKRAVVLEGRKDTTEAVLTQVLASQIRSALPVLPRLARSWELLYSLDQHGISLRTLYARCAEPTRLAATRPSLLVVRDAGGGCFGAFIGEGIHSNPGTYYGGGESFLWRANSDTEVNVFRWTGRNDYVALCETDSISFGGGDGYYGLFLDDVLQDGSSAPCPTFDNVSLCSTTESSTKKSVPFECVGVEVWAIGN